MNTNDINNLTIPRILDANLDRAREGLRIIEEWCRLGLNHAEMAENCKKMRQALAQWHTDDLRIARDIAHDPGIALSHPQEETRTTIDHLLRANLCRTQEALRVLEEYGKLYKDGMGVAFKELRYQVYHLESQLMAENRLKQLKEAQLYLVTSPRDNLLTVVEAALQGGVKLVQYRDKEANDAIRLANAQQLCHLCHDYGALFLVNDRVDLALAVNADGVHLGQQDLPVAVARQLLGSHRLIGRSTTNPDEMARAIAEKPDYIGVGPVYATPTKAGKAPAGLDYVRYAAAHSSLPWFAIGGIDAKNVAEVIEAGANNVAVVRAVMDAENPQTMTQTLLKVVAKDCVKQQSDLI